MHLSGLWHSLSDSPHRIGPSRFIGLPVMPMDYQMAVLYPSSTCLAAAAWFLPGKTVGFSEPADGCVGNVQCQSCERQPIHDGSRQKQQQTPAAVKTIVYVGFCPVYLHICHRASCFSFDTMAVVVGLIPTELAPKTGSSSSSITAIAAPLSTVTASSRRTGTFPSLGWTMAWRVSVWSPGSKSSLQHRQGLWPSPPLHSRLVTVVTCPASVPPQQRRCCSMLSRSV